ncbi:MAG: DMT family transporter [Rhodospirillales bacterium]|nr:DMT family transporter [Rhodospirillales bacterium]MDP6804696.1 DMT family transporter [Rhodospirillales bacterium]
MSEPAQRSSLVLMAVGLMVLSSLVNTSVFGLVKYVSAEIHPFEIVFFRSLFGFVTLSPILIRHGLSPLRTRHFGLYVVRVFFSISTTLAIWMALSLAPLAKVTAISFSQPLFATVLAALFIGEAIRARRITALAVGFLGTLIIVRPGIGTLDAGSILAVVGAACSATTVIFIRVLSRTDSTTTLTLYSTILGAPLSFMAAVWFWKTPTLEQLGWLALIGVAGVIGQLLFTQAYKLADVAVVSPATFTRLIWAALIGYVVFAEVPDRWVWLGGGLIFAAVTYITYRERALGPEDGPENEREKGG